MPNKIVPGSLVRIAKGFREAVYTQLVPSFNFNENLNLESDPGYCRTASDMSHPYGYYLNSDTPYIVIDVFTQFNSRWIFSSDIMSPRGLESQFGHERLIILTPHGPAHIAAFYMECIE